MQNPGAVIFSGWEGLIIKPNKTVKGCELINLHNLVQQPRSQT
jgi:hypothetical protein